MRFLNGNVHTLDTNPPRASAIACDGGRITAVGEPRDLPARGDEVDLRGRTVLPGMIDAHFHLRNLAEARQNVDLNGAVSAEEAARRVATRAEERGDGGWITGRGWDEARWPDRSLPNAALLDAAAPQHPVALDRHDGHAVWVNHAALVAAGIDDATADPPGGRIVRDAAGRATGVLIDNASKLVDGIIPEMDAGQLREAVRGTIQECLRYGLTGVHEMGVDDRTIATYRSLIDEDQFPFRVLGAIGGPGRTWHQLRERGPERRYRDRLSVAAIKLYADGALGSRGAAMLAPYDDDPGNSGLELASAENLERWTRDAVAHGFQVCIHAIGDRGNRTVLDIYERVLAGHAGSDLRLRVEHAQHLTPRDLPRFKQIGVIPSMQPAHCTSDEEWAKARIGEARAPYAYAWRSLLDTGVIIAGGSDAPVESPNPMLGLSAAVTRQAPGASGPVWHSEQRMSREEAVRAFTSWAAYAGFDDDVAGSLGPGKYADFIVLDRDVMTCPPEEIAETRVLMTVSGGVVAYRDEAAW